MAEKVGSDILIECDVQDDASLDAVFDTLKDTWGTFDFVVHAVAFSDKSQLKGRYYNTTKENFLSSSRLATAARRVPFSASRLFPTVRLLRPAVIRNSVDQFLRLLQHIYLHLLWGIIMKG